MHYYQNIDFITKLEKADDFCYDYYTHFIGPQQRIAFTFDKENEEGKVSLDDVNQCRAKCREKSEKFKCKFKLTK